MNAQVSHLEFSLREPHKEYNLYNKNVFDNVLKIKYKGKFYITVLIMLFRIF